MWGVLYEDSYVMMIARVAVPVTVAIVLVAAAVLGLVCKSISGVFDGRGAGGSDGDFGSGGGAGGVAGLVATAVGPMLLMQTAFYRIMKLIHQSFRCRRHCQLSSWHYHYASACMFVRASMRIVGAGLLHPC